MKELESDHLPVKLDPCWPALDKSLVVEGPHEDGPHVLVDVGGVRQVSRNELPEGIELSIDPPVEAVLSEDFPTEARRQRFHRLGLKMFKNIQLSRFAFFDCEKCIPVTSYNTTPHNTTQQHTTPQASIYFLCMRWGPGKLQTLQNFYHFNSLCSFVKDKRYHNYWLEKEAEGSVK